MLAPRYAVADTFTIQELSRATGVSVASIKFYVREGLLPAPVSSRPRRAYYDGRHAQRLTTIRALRDAGGLSLDAIGRALAAIERPGSDVVDVIAPAIDALAARPAAAPAALVRARADVKELFVRERLSVRARAGSRETIAGAIASLRRIGSPIAIEDLARYVALLRPLAKEEIENEETSAVLRSDKESSLELAILGTVLFEPILIGLRRALHEHYTTALVRKKPAREKPARKKKRAT
ncbi:MAG: MerR family transcriptional regulator [Labilithrix sp.]|nr:MerR family transcriptional regulator [Labilithrix sp.]MCW5812329.1 MerR family transcriptional regulator [Labilithrix sp.]